MMNWEKLLAFGRFGEQAKGTSTDTARSEFEVLGGAEIVTVGADTYPDPPLVI